MNYLFKQIDITEDIENNYYGFIFMSINKINGKKYIGKCIFKRRSISWKTYMGSGTYIKRAVKKYGYENFYKVILDLAKTKQELEGKEEYYLKRYRAVEDNMFYNLKYTSIGGDTFTHNPNKEKTREIKRQQSLGKNNPMYGKPKNKKMLDSVRKPIIVNEVEYISVKDCADKTGEKYRRIHYRLNNDLYPNYYYKK